MTIGTKRNSTRVIKKNNSKPLVFLVCLLIATALWFIKAMEKSYETTIALPVRYVNIPHNNILVNPPPSKLNVKIRSMGFTLLRHKIGLTFTPINLDIKPFSQSNGNKNLNKFTILTNSLIPQIAEQITQDITILRVSPDTLNIHYDYIAEKKVRVSSRIEVSCQSQYSLSDSIKIIPPVIVVKGPVSILDTLREIHTSSIKFNNLSTSVHSIVLLDKLNQLDYSVNKVNIEIPVSQFTEFNDKITLRAFNVPDNLSLITFPGKVNVSCLIAFDKFNSMNTKDFVIGVDFNDIASNSNTLPVKIINRPEFIKSLKIQPLQVEYIIKRK